MAVLVGYADKFDPGPGQCESLYLNSLHRFMLPWLDHARKEGAGGIINQLYADFGANPGRSEFRHLGENALLQYRYTFTNNSPAVVSVSNLLYLH